MLARGLVGTGEFRPFETVRQVCRLLQTCKHSGFPVVAGEGGKLCGFVLRSQLRMILHRRLFALRLEAVDRSSSSTGLDSEQVGSKGGEAAGRVHGIRTAPTKRALLKTM